MTDNRKPFSESRATYETVIVLGPSGYGKSSYVDETQEKYRARGGRVWVIDPASNWLHHPGRVWRGLENLDKDLRKLQTVGPGLIVFDDADLYFRHPTGARLEIIVANRHWQKDVMVVSRRPQGIHKDLFMIADSLVLFCQRQAYARAYLAKELDDATLVRKIPSEKFRYLFVHRPTNTHAIQSTTPRKVVTASDRKL
jgi:hypothetical protein